MKTEEFVRKDGTKGENYLGEAGDKFKSRYSAIRVNNTGKYDNYSLGVLTEKGKEIYLKLTKGQYTSLSKTEDLTGKTIEFYNYKNEFGDQIGAKAI